MVWVVMAILTGAAIWIVLSKMSSNRRARDIADRLQKKLDQGIGTGAGGDDLADLLFGVHADASYDAGPVVEILNKAIKADKWRFLGTTPIVEEHEEVIDAFKGLTLSRIKAVEEKLVGELGYKLQEAASKVWPHCWIVYENVHCDQRERFRNIIKASK